MAIPSLIKSEFPDRAPISIGESGLGGASSIHVVQQIYVRIPRSIGESGVGGASSIHVVQQIHVIIFM